MLCNKTKFSFHFIVSPVIFCAGVTSVSCVLFSGRFVHIIIVSLFVFRRISLVHVRKTHTTQLPHYESKKNCKLKHFLTEDETKCQKTTVKEHKLNGNATNIEKRKKKKISRKNGANFRDATKRAALVIKV